MFYYVLKIWANLSFRLYFKRIFLSGVEHIPKDDATLFIVNHPNSFMEACLVASFQHRALHFLVRGDMFEKKWLKPILRWTNQIPIFRFKDGFSKLKQNKSTFDESFKVLKEGKALLIFPEASTQMVRFLRPLQKGAARLAIGSVEEYRVDKLFVVPTGVYYEKPTKTRSDVILKFGKPLEMNAWLATVSPQADKLTELTEVFQNMLQEVMISIRPDQDSNAFEDLVETLEPMVMPGQNSGVFRDEQTFVSMHALADQYQHMHKDELHDLHQEIRSINRWTKAIPAMNFKLYFSKWIQMAYAKWMVILFVVSLPALLIYGIPLILAKQFSKSKIKHIEFYAPVRLAVSMFLHLLFTILVASVGYHLLGLVWTVLFILLLQVSLFAWGRFRDLAKLFKPVNGIRNSQQRPQLLMQLQSIKKRMKGTNI